MSKRTREGKEPEACARSTRALQGCLSPQGRRMQRMRDIWAWQSCMLARLAATATIWNERRGVVDHIRGHAIDSFVSYRGHRAVILQRKMRASVGATRLAMSKAIAHWTWWGSLRTTSVHRACTRTCTALPPHTGPHGTAIKQFRLVERVGGDGTIRQRKQDWVRPGTWTAKKERVP